MYSEAEADTLSEDRYLIFDVGSVRLATPLLSVREIVEPIPYKSVSNPFAPFLGLANLRGQIIGVIDFGSCLSMAPVDGSPDSKMIVFDGEDSKLGILVSDVHSPIVINAEDIITEALTEAVIPAAAVLGIAKITNDIIPIVSLAVLAKSLALLGAA
ncbi:MAG: hypothetical protein EOP07_25035 [Proteobacteria bacterium]|nr:MAG: hypothetical protein EOP07_25035 [Pseudomonadota bacterium]